MNIFTTIFFSIWLKMGRTGNVPGNSVLGSFQSNLYTKVWVWFGEAYVLYFDLFLGCFFSHNPSHKPILKRVLNINTKCYLIYEQMIQCLLFFVFFFFFSIGFITVPSVHNPHFSYPSDSDYGCGVCEVVINKIRSINSKYDLPFPIQYQNILLKTRYKCFCLIYSTI